MNLIDSYFLCLDIGTSGVRGIATHVKDANIDESKFFTVDSYDTVFALTSVIDELEKQIGTHFESAYITGNFGPSFFDIVAKNMKWSGEHKITANDIRHQISSITPPENYYPLHLIPLRYATPSAREQQTPIGIVDYQLLSVFSTIFYSHNGINQIYEYLRDAHIQPDNFYDPQFLQNAILRKKKQKILFIDFGAQYTTASIWHDRGPVFHTKIQSGGTDITNKISQRFNIPFEDAERIKKCVASLVPTELDRFTPADISYEFSRTDINEVIIPEFTDIINKIKTEISESFKKFKPTKIILTGGGAKTTGLSEIIEQEFGIPTESITSDITIRTLFDYIWESEKPHREKFLYKSTRWSRKFKWVAKLFHRKKKPCHKSIPIMPSTLCFDMTRPETYSLFKSGGISKIHVDIMDGFYVNNVAGSIDELRTIRSHTKSHLHVHLMTESPKIWATDAIDAGADTIILSTNTSGLRAAIKIVRASGKRVGVALNPNSDVSLLKPILRNIDEVMVMSVTPGAAGQHFDPSALHKISVLNAMRKKNNLNLTISVDGGINEKTAPLCWQAGADMLVSGSYLAHAPDFPLAVQKLLKKDSTN